MPDQYRGTGATYNLSESTTRLWLEWKEGIPGALKLPQVLLWQIHRLWFLRPRDRYWRIRNIRISGVVFILKASAVVNYAHEADRLVIRIPEPMIESTVRGNLTTFDLNGHGLVWARVIDNWRDHGVEVI